MRTMYKPNISATARVVSTIAGAALSVAGHRRSSRTLELLGAGLVARGASGWCPVTAAVRRNGHSHLGDDFTKAHLAGSRGVNVEDVITIKRPIMDVYAYWRNLDNLPRFMEHLESVEVRDRWRSRWTAIGPLGMRVEWDPEIISDVPPTLLSWKSVGDADVISAGSVRFKAVGESATELRVRLQYDPPAGRLGATVAWMLGEDPQRQIAEDLRRFKEVLETDEAAGFTYRATPSSQRVRRDLDSGDLGEFGSMR